MAITPNKRITIEPIAHGEGSAVDFGAVVSGADIENLTGESLPRVLGVSIYAVRIMEREHSGDR